MTGGGAADDTVETREHAPRIAKLDDLRFGPRSAGRLEYLAIEFVSFRIHRSQDRPSRMVLASGFGKRCEDRNTDRRHAQGQREATRRGNADPDAGKGARTDSDGNAIDVGQGLAAIGKAPDR